MQNGFSNGKNNGTSWGSLSEELSALAANKSRLEVGTEPGNMRHLCLPSSIP